MQSSQSVSCKRNARLQKLERPGIGPIDGRPMSSRMRLACTFTHRFTCQLAPSVVTRSTLPSTASARALVERSPVAALAAEAQRLVARRRFDAAEAIALAREAVGAADVPAVRHERRQIAILDALPAALVGQPDVLGLNRHAAGLPPRFQPGALPAPLHPHVGVVERRAEHGARANRRKPERHVARRDARRRSAGRRIATSTRGTDAPATRAAIVRAPNTRALFDGRALSPSLANTPASYDTMSFSTRPCTETPRSRPGARRELIRDR